MYCVYACSTDTRQLYMAGTLVTGTELRMYRMVYRVCSSMMSYDVIMV